MPRDEKIILIEGSLMYRSESCKFAFNDLQEISEELNEKMSSADFVDGKELNKIGRYHRYCKSVLILELAGLFDSRNDVLSLPRLCVHLKKINHSYSADFKGQVKKNRRRA